MKFKTVVAVAGALIISSGAFAEGGADRLFDSRLKDHAKAMEQYALSKGKNIPVVKQYEYGMKIDVAKVVGVVQADGSCEVVPAAMTYEDSSGKLNTLKYSLTADCNSQGG